MIGRPCPVTGSLESPVLLARVRTGAHSYGGRHHDAASTTGDGTGPRDACGQATGTAQVTAWHESGQRSSDRPSRLIGPRVISSRSSPTSVRARVRLPVGLFLQ